jgi:hypothetical protein
MLKSPPLKVVSWTPCERTSQGSGKRRQVGYPPIFFSPVNVTERHLISAIHLFYHGTENRCSLPCCNGDETKGNMCLMYQSHCISPIIWFLFIFVSFLNDNDNATIFFYGATSRNCLKQHFKITYAKFPVLRVSLTPPTTAARLGGRETKKWPKEGGGMNPRSTNMPFIY